MLRSNCSTKPVNTGTLSKPSVVKEYNHSMNGVDIADQLTVFYSFVRKTRKWWRKLFFYLLEVSTVNSYLLYKHSVLQHRSHLGYRRAIVEQVAKLSLQQAPPRPGAGAPRKAAIHDLPQRLDRRPHFLGKSPVNRDCVVCSQRETGQRHKTLFFLQHLHKPPIPLP